MYRFEDNQIVFSGWEKGIAGAPYSGLADMRNADIISTPGEVAVAFANATVTLPPVFNGVAYTSTASTDRLALASVTGLYEGCAVVLSSNTSTGLTNAIVYYVRNISALTFQLSLFPRSVVVNFTTDGTGSLTTYQYGNQRGLPNNGSPVSYWEAPEIGGVLLVDLSNYVWLWQQGSTGATPLNSLLFLGNIGGIGAEAGNQTGVVYWNGQVVLIQQPNIVNTLDWAVFSSGGIAWNYTSVRGLTALPVFVTTSVAIPYYYNYQEWVGTSTAVVPTIVHKDRLFAAASLTTITSASFSVQTGDIIYAVAYTWNNIAVSSITFAGNAMVGVTFGNSTNPFPRGVRVETYTVPADTTGVLLGTYASAVTNRGISYHVIKNGTSATNVFSSGTGATQGIENRMTDRPNSIGVVFWFSNNDVATIANPNSLNRLTGAVTSSVGQDWMYADEQGFKSSTSLKKNVPITVGDNNIIYYGSGDNHIGSLNAAIGYLFNPSDSTSYNLNLSALDLPQTERVESLLVASGKLFIGATSNKLYPWDTISPSFNNPIEFPEYGLTTLVPSNNKFYVMGGNLGRVYVTNGASASIFKELPDDITGTSRAQFFFWDGNIGNSELYFTCQAFPNGSPTALDTLGGIWAINANTGALRLVQTPSVGYGAGYGVLTRMVCPVGHGQTQEFLRPVGQGLLMGYTNGTTHRLEFSTSVPYDEYATVIDTDIVPVGTFFTKQTFEHIEYKLATPMVAGESIRISQRSNLTANFTQVAEFTTPGVISGQASINWENVEWVQFRIELQSTPTNPSFVRLRELRLR